MMSGWAWIGLAWGVLFFVWGVLVRTGAIRAALYRQYLYYPWYRRNALFAFMPIGLALIAGSLLPFLNRTAPFGLWLAAFAATLVALMFFFVIIVHPPWWMKPRWIREADTGEWGHLPGPDSRLASLVLATIAILLFALTCVFTIVNGFPKF